MPGLRWVAGITPDVFPLQHGCDVRGVGGLTVEGVVGGTGVDSLFVFVDVKGTHSCPAPR